MSVDLETQVDSAWTDWYRGPGMFYVSLFYLALLAAILVLWIDVPRAVETSEVLNDLEGGELSSQPLSDEELAFENLAFRWGYGCGWLLLAIWPFFVAEQLYFRLSSDSGSAFRSTHPYWWVFCVLPPLRLCAHRYDADEQIWLPRLGLQRVDRKLRQRLDHAFSLPMICIALLILPVLGLQFYFQERIANYPGLRLALHFGTGSIWFAFAVEFIVMVSVAHNKLTYCKKHWLDLLIILLPLISFLRTLRVMRAARLAKIGKLQQLSRVVRVYRLRGVVMRALRALMLLEVVHRLLRTKPHDRLKQLESQYVDKQHELEELAEKIQALKTRLKEANVQSTQQDFEG